MARGTVGMLILQVGGIGLGYVLQILLARWMGSAAYGAYTYVFAWASTVALATGMGLPAAVLRFVPAYQAEGDLARLHGLLKSSNRLVFGLGTGLSLIATAVILALDAVRGLDAVPLLLLGAWSVPLLALVNLRAETLRAARRIGWAYAPQMVLRPFLVAGGAYVLLHEDARLTSTEEVLEVGLNRAVTLLAEAAEKGGRRRGPTALRQLGAHPDDGEPIAVMEGRYGPYVKHGRINATLPRGTEPEAVTLEEAVRLIAERAAKGPAKRRSTRTAKGKASKAKGAKRKSAAKPKSRSADASAETG